MFRRQLDADNLGSRLSQSLYRGSYIISKAGGSSPFFYRISNKAPCAVRVLRVAGKPGFTLLKPLVKITVLHLGGWGGGHFMSTMCTCFWRPVVNRYSCCSLYALVARVTSKCFRLSR